MLCTMDLLLQMCNASLKVNSERKLKETTTNNWTEGTCMLMLFMAEHGVMPGFMALDALSLDSRR